MKYQLSPSILAADLGHLADQMALTRKGGAQWLHIDVMDGIFVPSISYGMLVVQGIRKYSDQFFDVHLMIVNPIRYIREFAESGADGITFHLEAAREPEKVIERIHSFGKKAGMAIKPATPIEAAFPYFDQLDLLLVMTVEPGFGGQPYIEASTERIEKAREEITRRGLTDKLNLEVDGGINQKTIQTVIDAGANVFVEGSAIFHGNVYENTKHYVELLRQAEDKSAWN